MKRFTSTTLAIVFMACLFGKMSIMAKAADQCLIYPEIDASYTQVSEYLLDFIGENTAKILDGQTISAHVLFPYSSTTEMKKGSGSNNGTTNTQFDQLIQRIIAPTSLARGVINCGGWEQTQYVASENTWEYNYYFSISNNAMPAVMQKLFAIASEAKAYSSTPYGQLEYINQYLIDHVKYGMEDPESFYSHSGVASTPLEAANTVESALIDGYAVCGGYTAVVGSLCFILGIPQVCLFGFDEKRQEGHVWNCVYIDGSWKMIDTTWNDTSGHHKKYFLVDQIDDSVHNVAAYDNLTQIQAAKELSIMLQQSVKRNTVVTTAPSAWAVEQVDAAIAAGLVPENLQQNYTEAVSRGEVAEMFIRLLEKSSEKDIDALLDEKGVQINPTAFTDTTDKNVLAANALGIINGVGSNRFDPNGTFTRAQIAVILNRTAEVLGVETDGYTHAFTDVSGHWCDTDLGWPVHAGIINGVGNDRFDPDGVLTTEQSIVMAQRALEALAKS